ncbi:hypothetical protein GCM10008018_57590 [Paenibacillus marchantiophytorum]|uniref:Uncharacterized protein n=1 Tax=Paenibacillus marchantiophytorum TaxID=1619310 RepID=A0ABQ1F9Q5_9BACL|nr:S-layer homology domain-containing protein [Paenibacillus marchantiophytorum]GGA04150.1 hypothetical protein GCM10008018_57590 [Paenibacillus marchantiophytorum]
MNERHAKHGLGKIGVWSIVILMVYMTLFAVPVQAADQWIQYAKIGQVSDDVAGTFAGPGGVAVDSESNVYVADSSNHRIQKLTAATGIWSEWMKAGGGYGSELGEFSSPVSVAVYKADILYVADSSNHRIQKLDIAAGTWSEWKKSDGKPGSGLGEFSDPKGLAVDKWGNLYVADSRNNRIQKLTAATGVWSEWASDIWGGQVLGQFKDPKGVAVDSSGEHIYVADSGNHRIQMLTVATGLWSEWKKNGGGAGSGLGEFNQPFGVALDSGDNVYVSDYNNHRIQKRDAASGDWSEWKKSGGGSGNGLGEFNHPKGLTVDSKRNVYVADYDNHRIQKLSAAGEQWSEWGYRGAIIGQGLGEFRFPNGLSLDSRNNLYVADFGNHRLQKLDAATGVWSEWKKSGGGSGSELGEFDGPTDVAVDKDRNVYVSDFYNHRIQKFTAETGVWSQWKKNGGGSGSGLGEFEYPSGVAVDSYGNVYVADYGNHRIQKLDVAAGAWSEWKKSGGGSGSGLGEFNEPSGVEVDSAGNVYVADMSNHRIQKLDADTGAWSEWKKNGGGPGSGLGEFNEPYSLAVDSAQNVYVADSNNNRIQKLNVTTNVWSEWAKLGGRPGSHLGEFRGPLGVAVDSSGKLYVADSANHRIQKLDRVTTPPDAPTAVTAEVVKGESQAKVKFTAPVNDGGSAITGYTVTANPGGLTANGTSSPITVTGLTYGTTYTFTVIATNSVGSSLVSDVSNAVKPEAVVPTTQPSSSSGGTSDDSDAIILVNGKLENAGTVKVTRVNSQSVTTITMDQNKLAKRLAAEGQHAVVTIPVKGLSDVVIGELDGRMVRNMEDNQAVLEIKTDRGSYKIPAQQLNIKAISDQVGKSDDLQEIKVQIQIAVPTADMVKVVENAAAQGTFTLIAPPLNFTVRGIYGDKTIEVASFNVYVERTLAIPEGVDPTKITTGVVIEPDGTVRHVPTKVVVIDGKHYAKVSSLTNSTYTVVWHPVEFSDVANHWAKLPVNNMGSRMVIEGTGNGKFNPDREITRAEFAAILVRGLGLKLENGAVPFSDVKTSDWYSSAVKTAYAYQLINGFEDGTFHPLDLISREQAMTMIAKAMKITGLKAKLPSPAAQAVLQPFQDANQAAGWAKDGIVDCLQAGIAAGRNGSEIAPKSYITRAEVAAIVERLLQKSDLI